MNTRGTAFQAVIHGQDARATCCGDLMPVTETGLFFTLLVLMLGAGLFLRIVAKEKERREKWLVFRQETRIKELKQKQRQAQAEEEKVIVVH